MSGARRQSQSRPHGPGGAWLRACLLATATLLLLGAFAAEALASRPHELTASFGVKCIAEPCEGEALEKPQGIAVNEESGDVYVADQGAAGQHGRVAVFDKEGHFLFEFNGSGALPGEEHAAGSLKRTGEIETGRFEEPQAIAVDNTCLLRKLSKTECEAQDPSDGDVYVEDAGEKHLVIDKYSPAGEYLGQISEGEETGGKKHFAQSLDGVAVDPQGDVWVYQETLRLQKYDSATPNAFLEAKRPLSVPGSGEPGLAIDAQGNFYLDYIEVAGGKVMHRVAKVSPAGEAIEFELLKEDTFSLGADRLTGNVVLANHKSLVVLDSALEEVERLGEGDLSEASGIGVDSSSGTIYAADAGASASAAVLVFGAAAPTTPKVQRESFANVTSSGARLEAQINPRSEEGEAQTSWQFQYGRCASALSCPQSGYEASVPAPAGQLPADFELHTVTASLEGLAPGTAYHFRALARNGHGEGQAGAEEILLTQGTGGALGLPDDRGWELVSPPEKLGALIEPIAETGVVQAAAGGQAISYLANAPTEAQPQGYSNEVQVLSRRGHASWSSLDIAIPHTSPTGLANGPGPEYKFFDRELQLAAVQPFGEFVPQLSEEASEPTAYLHDLTEGCANRCFRPLVTAKAGVANVPEGTRFGEVGSCPKSNHIACGPEFLGASEDLAHVELRSKAPLSSGAIEEGLYEWSGGLLSPTSVLEGGEPAPPPNGLGDEAQGAARRAISSDGTRVVWENPQGLYLRDSAREETVQIDKAEACGGCQSGGGVFQIASADDSRIFFTDTRKLSADSGAAENKQDLYECAVLIRAGKLACALRDLTPMRENASHEEEAAEVQGSVLGASEDGSYLYFVAKSVQSEAENARGQHAIAGQPNLYLRHGEASEFVATLAEGDETDWDEPPRSLRSQPTRVSSDGRFLELMSEAELTEYDNRDVSSGKPAAEVYLYDAASRRLSCASCDPSGGRPVGVEYAKLEPTDGGLVGGPRGIWPERALVAANVPGWTAMQLTKFRHQPRYLTDEGRLFFNSANALVAQDTNGTQDVYEYEPPGVGSCSEASETYVARSGGCVALISSGTSPLESAFLDASESGNDVFFLTAARLSAIDTDSSLDVYDAHVCTSEEPCITYSPSEESSCGGESSCKAQPSPQPLIYGAPASATLQSTGNLAPAASSTSAASSSAPPKSAEQLRLEKLAKALKACRAKKNAKKRRSCEASARKRYAKPAKKAKKKTKKAKKKAKKSSGGSGR